MASAAERWPDRPAVLGAGERWTYRELDGRVRRWCAALRAAGVRPGDRVGVLSANRPEGVAQVFAVARLGAACVPFNIRLTAAELIPQLELVEPRAILAEPSLQAVIPESALLLTLEEGGGREEPGAAAPALETDAACAVLFTSGTTGRAKAVVLTVESFLSSARASAANIGGGPADRWLLCLPLFHIGGLAMAFRCAVYGASLLVHERFDPAAVNEALDAHAVTHASLVATTLARTLEARGERPFPPSLRAVLIGGGPVPAPLLERARALAAPVLQTYGLTEACSQVTTERPAEADGTTAGHPLEGIEVRIVDEQGARLPPGEVGEIEVRGATVMRGYLRDESETHQALWKGWLRTRDLGSLDERGRLRVFARRTDLILSGGENVYPAEVEAVLLAHPALSEAAVVGVPDERWGQVPVAVFAARREVSLAELEAFCRERLAGFKVPRRWIQVEALSRTAAGKVDRAALGRIAGAHDRV